MGKASKWFKALFGFKKSDPTPPKKRWSFAKDRLKSQNGAVSGGYDDDEASRHAVAVAAATAAVADVAVAAAQAAAAVVKLTSGVSQNGVVYGNRAERAAVVIQSYFRAYLSRRALRALKALVKLQALVRGHILRKQNVYKLRQMQAIVRAQARARARAGRDLFAEVTHSSTNSSPSNYTLGRATQGNLDEIMLARRAKHEHLKRNGSKSSGNVIYDPEKSHLIHHWIDRRTGEKSWEQGSFTRIIPMDDERSDKILEIDTGKPYTTPKSKKIPHSLSHSSDQYYQSFSMSNDDSTAHQPLSPLQFVPDVEGNAFCTTDNSPQYYSASSMGGSSKRAPFTPTKSDGSRSHLSDHPSYMAYTESSKAKVRSLSAPKQRTQYERSSSTNRNSIHGYSDSRANTKKVATLHANFMNKAYPGSGRLDRLGMPIRDISGFRSGQLHRH